MSLAARCTACGRELLVQQLTQPGSGFRCPFCGRAFAPGYATIAPGVAARVLAAHDALLAALKELHAMVGDRLELDGQGLAASIAEAVPTPATTVTR